MPELARATKAQFWYWINERHSIYLKRALCEPPPWTHDPIFEQYKFTNVFRQLDRGTVWMLENIVRGHTDNLPLLLANIVLYRMFNWTGTGEAIGFQTQWQPKKVAAILHKRLQAKLPVFTSAHIVRAEHGRPKIDSVLEAVEPIWNDKDALTALCMETKSLQVMFEKFLTYRFMGDFMSYEFVTDLVYTPLLWDSIDRYTWANAGPGARRGLLRLFGTSSKADTLPQIHDLLAESRFRLHPYVPSLDMRAIEHSLCEFDKYIRVQSGEGRPRCRFVPR